MYNLSFFFLVLCALVLGPQAVLAKSFKFKFSKVEQCAPVSIEFEGDQKPDDSTTAINLTLLPFNATPIRIPVPRDAMNSSGVTVTFLPLPAEIMFVASLDDADGDNIPKISDVTRVFPSPTGNASCLGTAVGETISPSFGLPESLTQCEPFDVLYNGSAPSAPTVRVLSPKGGADFAELVQDFPEQGRASYMAKGREHGDQVVLSAIVADDFSRSWSSLLITITGDSQSSEECFQKDDDDDNNKGREKGEASSKMSIQGSGLTNGAIIGLSVGGGLLFVIVALVALYFLRRRQRNRRMAKIQFDPALLEKRTYDDGGFKRSYADDKASIDEKLSPPPFILRYSGGFVKDPPYATEKYSPTVSGFRDSAGSWISEKTAALRQAESDRSVSREAVHSHTGTAINPYDIEHMLNMAAHQNSETSASPPGLQAVPDVREPEPAVTEERRPSPTRKATLDSTALSSPYYTVNRFGDSESFVGAPPEKSLPSPARSSTVGSHLSYASTTDFAAVQRVQRPPVAARTLPSSPRSNLLQAPRSRFSDPSLMDGGSIGVVSAGVLPSRDSVSSWGDVKEAGVAR